MQLDMDVDCGWEMSQDFGLGHLSVASLCCFNFSQNGRKECLRMRLQRGPCGSWLLLITYSQKSQMALAPQPYLWRHPDSSEKELDSHTHLIWWPACTHREGRNRRFGNQLNFTPLLLSSPTEIILINLCYHDSTVCLIEWKEHWVQSEKVQNQVKVATGFWGALTSVSGFWILGHS
jgi:hypothetical protein